MYYIWDKTSQTIYDYYYSLRAAEEDLSRLIERGYSQDMVYIHPYMDGGMYSTMRDKFECEEIFNPVWYKEPWFKETVPRDNMFVHIDEEHPEFVTFFPDEKKLELNIPTRSKPGRFLKKYFSDVLSSDDITKWADVHKEQYMSPMELSWAMTPEEIAKVYSSPAAFSSCMQYGVDRVDGDGIIWEQEQWPHDIPAHPTSVYGAGDLSIAYLHMGERIIARALVWKEKKLVGRVYGNAAALRASLRAEGIDTHSDNDTYDTFEGARVLKVPYFPSEKTLERHSYATNSEHSQLYLSPYIDGGCVYAVDSEDDPNVFILHHGDEINYAKRKPPHTVMGTAIGYSQHSIVCDHCGSHFVFGDTYTYTKKDGIPIKERWCNTCVSREGFYSNISESYHDESVYTRITVYRTSSYGELSYTGALGFDPIARVGRNYYLESDLITLDGGDKIPKWKNMPPHIFTSALDNKQYRSEDNKVRYNDGWITRAQFAAINSLDIANPSGRPDVLFNIPEVTL